MKTKVSSAISTKHYPQRSFFGKLEKRRVIGTLAAFISGGWFVYEIVHWILVDHYHLPERLKDVAIVSILGIMFSVITWRWFRGETRRKRIKLEFVLIPLFVFIAIFLDVKFFLHLEKQVVGDEDKIIEEIPWKNSIAVLPFVDMSSEKNQEYFSDGLTEELLDDLSKIKELRVAGRTSSFQFKRKNEDLRVIGQKLNVATILEGSVRKEGKRVRITAQLNNAANGYHIWSETYDRELNDIFEVQDEIARSVAGALEVTLLGNKRSASQTKNTEAYNAFLLGRYFYRRQTKENLTKAIIHYQQALELDPEYARAWAGLGASLAYQAGLGYVPSEEGFSRARAAVERALVLDENLAYAHAIKGWIQMTYDWDWFGADASYRRALSLDSAEGLLEAAQLSVALGRFNQALALSRRAAERDPLSPQVYMTVGLAAWYSGRIKEAVSAYKKVTEFIPELSGAHGMLGEVFITQSNLREALAELEKEEEPFWSLQGLALIYHALGRKRDSDIAQAELIDKYQSGDAYNIAQVYAFRGEFDLAFEWLDRAYSQHDGGIFLLKVDPFLENLRLDSRYTALLKKMWLPA